MIESFNDISDLINDQVRQITRKKDKDFLKALGIKEEPEEVIIMFNKPEEDIVAFIRRKDLSLIKAMPKVYADEIADEIRKGAKPIDYEVKGEND